MWAGRVTFGVIVAVLVTYLVVAGLDRAAKVASGIGVVVALIALGAPYLFPSPSQRELVMEPDRVEDSGAAHATGAGRANTGVDAVGDERPAQVTGSGGATAEGPGSVANTGIQRRARS
jgi:hypothetical protein